MQVVKLSDLIPQTDTVEVQTGISIQLNPLSLEQIAKLFWEQQDQFLAIYQEGTKAEPNYGPMVLAAPRMVAEMIAMSAGQEEQIDTVLNLAGTVQLTALAKVWRLSVPDPKKLTEALTELMGELRKTSAAVAQPKVTEKEQSKPSSTT